ncbi:MAG: hypothetical protein R3D89_08380 [Sphingomonadaceae bacterium]
MSRNRAAFLLGFAACLHIQLQPALAQDAADARIEEMIARQKAMFGVPSRRPRCAEGAPGEIVVCAQDQSRFRAAPTSEVEPKSKQALDNGELHAPDFSGGSCRGEPGCIVGGWAPPPIYIIDLEAIPEPPPGSDADLIAKGLKRAR